MTSLGAPICVSVLRLLILSGLVIANPDLIPFISFTWKSVSFSVIICLTVYIYFKACFTDPGTVFTCPTELLSTLEAAGEVTVTHEKDLKNKAALEPGSDGGIGRVRIRSRRAHHGYNTVRQNSDKHARERSKFGHQGDVWDVKRRRSNSSGSLSSDHSKVHHSIDQRTWDEKTVHSKVSDDSWSNCSDQSKDYVVDFGRDSSDQLSEGLTSEGEISGDHSHRVQSPSSGFLLLPAEMQCNAPVEESTAQPIYQVVAAKPSNKLSPSMSQPKSERQSDEGALYPSSAASSSEFWGKCLSTAQQTSYAPIHELPKHTSNLHFSANLNFLRKSLEHAGFPLQSHATPSATVGSALNYAVAATAAVPFIVVGKAANQIANTARGVFGRDNEVTRVLQSVQQATKVKSEDERHSISPSPPTDLELGTMQQEVKHKTIRSRPIQISEPTEALSAQLPDSRAPHLQEISSSPQPNKKQFSHTISQSVFNYRGIISRTRSGHPCQSNVQLRFCRICRKYQPLRTKHCSECGFCVRTMDHHCPWLGMGTNVIFRFEWSGQCVGEGNRLWFYWFLIFEAIELTWTMVGFAFMATRNQLEIETSPEKLPKIIIFNLYFILSFMTMLLLVIMVVCLIGYHSFLATSNMTTWENLAWSQITYLKDLSEKKGSPFSKGVTANLYTYCCPPFAWCFLRDRFSQYQQIHYGPDGEIIWEHGKQQIPPCCGSSCGCLGCCSD